MNSERTLQEAFIEKINNMEIKLKNILFKEESENNSNEKIIILINDISKLEIEIYEKLQIAMEMQSKEMKINKIKAEIVKYDKAIYSTEEGLYKIHGILSNGISTAQEKLSEINKAQQQQNTKNDILEMAKNYTKNYVIQAPLFWKPKDYVKPFPTGVQFIRGCLKHSVPLRDIPRRRNNRNSSINMSYNMRNLQYHEM
uniref:Mediator of RNA polymerase II transcription subunit 4 n=1 Tax=Parastrongyloides trichosuri TaxID=131310 RepID=A0A0N4ZYQ3_PARTI